MRALRIVLPLVAIFLVIGVAAYYSGHEVQAAQPGSGQFAPFLQGVTQIGYAGNQDRPGLVMLDSGDTQRVLALLRNAGGISPVAGAFNPEETDFVLSLEKDKSLYLLFGNAEGDLYCAYDFFQPAGSKPRLAKISVKGDELTAILASYRADYDAQFNS
jgi:hypothetical protein